MATAQSSPLPQAPTVGCEYTPYSGQRQLPLAANSPSFRVGLVCGLIEDRVEALSRGFHHLLAAGVELLGVAAADKPR
jgi:hypothetical protein